MTIETVVPRGCYLSILGEHGRILGRYCQRSFGVFTGEVFDVVLKFKPEVREDVLNYNFHPTQTMKPSYLYTISNKFDLTIVFLFNILYE